MLRAHFFTYFTWTVSWKKIEFFFIIKDDRKDYNNIIWSINPIKSKLLQAWSASVFACFNPTQNFDKVDLLVKIFNILQFLFSYMNVILLYTFVEVLYLAISHYIYGLILISNGLLLQYSGVLSKLQNNGLSATVICLTLK